MACVEEKAYSQQAQFLMSEMRSDGLKMTAGNIVNRRLIRENNNPHLRALTINL
jgi:hypothetical protein